MIPCDDIYYLVYEYYFILATLLTGELTMLTNYRQRSITYTIEDVDQNDSGVYYCRAINHAGTSQKQVTVTGKRFGFFYVLCML